MHYRKVLTILWITILAANDLAEAAAATDAPAFEKDVAPLLIRRCLECHQSANPSGGLSLQSAADLAKGGDSGVVVVAKSVK